MSRQRIATSQPRSRYKNRGSQSEEEFREYDQSVDFMPKAEDSDTSGSGMHFGNTVPEECLAEFFRG
jgi:hypothetical protein